MSSHACHGEDGPCVSIGAGSSRRWVMGHSLHCRGFTTVSPSHRMISFLFTLYIVCDTVLVCNILSLTLFLLVSHLPASFIRSIHNIHALSPIWSAGSFPCIDLFFLLPYLINAFNIALVVVLGVGCSPPFHASCLHR